MMAGRHISEEERVRRFWATVDSKSTYRGVQVAIAKLTDADVTEMRRLYREGASMTALARQFGVHIQTVRPALKGVTWAHVPGAVPARATGRLSPDQVRRIRRLRAAGSTYKALATEFGISPQMACGIVKGRAYRKVA